MALLLFAPINHCGKWDHLYGSLQEKTAFMLKVQCVGFKGRNIKWFHFTLHILVKIHTL